MPHFWRLKPEITNMEGFQQSTCVRKATYDFADLVAGLGFSLPRSRWDKGKTFDDTVIIQEKNEITCDMFVWPRQDRIVFFSKHFKHFVAFAWCFDAPCSDGCAGACFGKTRVGGPKIFVHKFWSPCWHQKGQRQKCSRKVWNWCAYLKLSGKNQVTGHLDISSSQCSHDPIQTPLLPFWGLKPLTRRFPWMWFFQVSAIDGTCKILQ